MTETQDLQGQAFLVTGAARGIGRATAERLFAAGANVMLADLPDTPGEIVAHELDTEGERARFRTCDVSDPEQVAALVEATMAAFGRLDGAVNNAGIGGLRQKLAEYPHDNWTQVLRVNLDGVFYCMQSELRAMLPNGQGSIVNVASIAGLQPFPKHAAYSASKHAVVGLTLSTAQEYAKAGIRINAVCPAFTKTAMVDELISYAPHMEQRLVSAIPQGRLGTSLEVAEAILWLLSRSASFVTGIALPVSGGM